VHVQVAMKAGLIALYLKWKYKIPFVLTEHWTGYYEQSADSLFRKSFLEKYLTRRILKSASLFLPVSKALGNQIRHYWAMIPFQNIPNVVDTRLFFPSPDIQENFRFIHISTLSIQKNPEGILHAFSSLLKTGQQAELVLVGPVSDAIRNLINGLDHADKIICKGEISYKEVGIELRKSSALILFSFYENMPCVILEALCTGIPVIATREGGIQEVIGKENGLLIDSGNELGLMDAMKQIIRDYAMYSKPQISSLAAKQFSYETIGREITQIYDSILK
jgi:glycosyltransferase involved in cell wall biosynthesis